MKQARHAKPAKPLLYKLTLLVLVILGILLFAGQFGLGGFRAFTVQSGSMEPSIGRNSVVLTLPTSSPGVGDVITYELPDQPDILITHRVIEIEQDGDQALYITRGDANEDADEDPLPRESIVGKVWLTIPWIGTVINLMRTDIGFILLIIVPATIIVYHEVLSLNQQIKDRRSKKRTANTAPLSPASSLETTNSGTGP